MPITSTLLIGNWEVHNIFQLLGEDEDSISLAIAWGLTNAPTLLALFLKRIVAFAGDSAQIQIRIHRYEAAGGITDIELIVPGEAHVIIEAKRGWVLPNPEQLTLYAGQSVLRSFPVAK